MNNFEFQKLMNLKQENEHEDKEPNLKENNILLDDKIKDEVEVLTIDQINEKREFNNQLNNINIKNQNK